MLRTAFSMGAMGELKKMQLRGLYILGKKMMETKLINREQNNNAEGVEMVGLAPSSIYAFIWALISNFGCESSTTISQAHE